MEDTNEGNVHLVRRTAGDTVIDIETTGTVYEIKVDGITKIAATVNEAKALLSGLVEALGLEYYLSGDVNEVWPLLSLEIDEKLEVGKE